MKIVITPRGFANYGEKELDKLRSHGFQVSYNNTGQAYSPEKFLELSKDADGIIVGVDLIDQAFIDQCPQLKVSEPTTSMLLTRNRKEFMLDEPLALILSLSQNMLWR